MSSFICDICKRDFKSEKGCKTHSTIMHPSHIKILPKKPFCCTKCDKSFDHATTLSRHGLEHKNEGEEARQQLSAILLSKVTRYRDMSHERRTHLLQRIPSPSSIHMREGPCRRQLLDSIKSNLHFVFRLVSFN